MTTYTVTVTATDDAATVTRSCTNRPGGGEDVVTTSTHKPNGISGYRTFTAWKHASDGNVTDALRDLVGARESIEREMTTMVHYARQQGASWATIAEGLGTSRQAAQQRYGR